jgi:hypothetical protein
MASAEMAELQSDYGSLAEVLAALDHMAIEATAVATVFDKCAKQGRHKRANGVEQQQGPTH